MAEAVGLRLGDRALIGDVERLAHGGRLLHRAQAGAHQVLDIDKLHEPVAVTRKNDRAIVATKFGMPVVAETSSLATMAPMCGCVRPASWRKPVRIR